MRGGDVEGPSPQKGLFSLLAYQDGKMLTGSRCPTMCKRSDAAPCVLVMMACESKRASLVAKHGRRIEHVRVWIDVHTASIDHPDTSFTSPDRFSLRPKRRGWNVLTKVQPAPHLIPSMLFLSDHLFLFDASHPGPFGRKHARAEFFGRVKNLQSWKHRITEETIEANRGYCCSKRKRASPMRRHRIVLPPFFPLTGWTRDGVGRARLATSCKPLYSRDHPESEGSAERGRQEGHGEILSSRQRFTPRRREAQIWSLCEGVV
ncbi:hypothetical protein B0T21DRAFT_105418 [Apiosordaria backusii]|uniref:Uncharacterized protein n=1 Tax=Apiosordaria backusii TaxID=314023 RepID=A0AA39ZVA8_9PEZI|nr:hypothetical protein B0T21DRAFT_105418 [Apiosordaria backusii]